MHGLSPARLEIDPLWDFLPKDSGLSSQDLQKAERRHSRSLSQPEHTKGKNQPKEGGGNRRGEVEKEEENSRKEGEELDGVGEGQGGHVEQEGNDDRREQVEPMPKQESRASKQQDEEEEKENDHRNGQKQQQENGRMHHSQKGTAGGGEGHSIARSQVSLARSNTQSRSSNWASSSSEWSSDESSTSSSKSRSSLESEIQSSTLNSSSPSRSSLDSFSSFMSTDTEIGGEGGQSQLPIAPKPSVKVMVAKMSTDADSDDGRTRVKKGGRGGRGRGRTGRCGRGGRGMPNSARGAESESVCPIELLQKKTDHPDQMDIDLSSPDEIVMPRPMSQPEDPDQRGTTRGNGRRNGCDSRRGNGWRREKSRGDAPPNRESQKGRGDTEEEEEAEEQDALTWEWICTSSLPTVRHIPKGARQTWSEVLEGALQKVVENKGGSKSWKILFALPKLCLRAPPRGGKKKVQRIRTTEWINRLLCRARQGNWAELVAEAKEAELKMGHKTASGQGVSRERVMMLVEEGQYSKAVKALVSEGLHELTEAVAAELKEKHPQRDDWARVAENKGSNAEKVSFDVDEVWKGLRGFPRGTAPGGTGGRAQHWVDALEILPADARNRILAPLATLCTRLANGGGPTELAQWLAGAPIFPLKKRGPGVRPIAVGEVLRRLIGRMFVNKPEIKEKTEEIFEKVGQLGVGVKGGAEIAVQLLRTWIEKKKAKGLNGWGVLKIDFENAYNTLDRGAIERVLKEEFPELLNWFRFCYGVPAVLSCQGKKLPFASKAGIQQGDPLGPLYFACGILILCRRIKAELKDSLSLWYLDDGSMAGPGEELLKAWKIVEEEAKKIGMRVNVKKCEIWSPEGHEKWQDDFPEQVVRLKGEGFELLGAPIGTKEFCEEYARKRVMKVKEVVAKLPLLADPQMELVLLRSCIGLPKFGFTLRSAPPEDIQTATKEFDDLMEKTSEERFGIQMGKEAAMQWHLPVRMGGVGISRAQDVSAPAYLGNVLLALPFLRKLVEEDLDVEEVPGASYAWDLLKEKVLESEDELPEECEEHLRELKLVFPPDVLRKMTKGPNALEEIFEETKEKTDEEGAEKKKKNKVKHQHFLHSLIHVKRLRQWLEVKHDEWENEEKKRDLLRKMAVIRDDESTGCAGNWLNVVPCGALETRMLGTTFTAALRWWTGAPTWQPESCDMGAATGKRCGKELDRWGDHAVICPVGPGRIARHNAVNLTWLAAERTAGFSVSREVGIKTDEHDQKRQADTLVYDWEGGICCAQDWVVPHIMTKAMLKAKRADPNRAAVEAEKGKEKKEGGRCEEVVGVKYLPMAVDTFGGFGPNAIGALERVANEMRVAKDMEAQVSSKRLAQKLRVVVMSHVATEILWRSKFSHGEEEMQQEVGEALAKELNRYGEEQASDKEEGKMEEEEEQKLPEKEKEEVESEEKKVKADEKQREKEPKEKEKARQEKEDEEARVKEKEKAQKEEKEQKEKARREKAREEEKEQMETEKKKERVLKEMEEKERKEKARQEQEKERVEEKEQARQNVQKEKEKEVEKKKKKEMEKERVQKEKEKKKEQKEKARQEKEEKEQTRKEKEAEKVMEKEREKQKQKQKEREKKMEKVRRGKTKEEKRKEHEREKQTEEKKKEDEKAEKEKENEKQKEEQKENNDQKREKMKEKVTKKTEPKEQKEKGKTNEVATEKRVPNVMGKKGKWEEWRKQTRPEGAISELKSTLCQLAMNEGLEVFDVGQGRGGECQYLAILCTVDHTSFAMRGRRIEWNYRVVDSFRAKIALWLRSHGDKWIGGETVRSLALMERGRWKEGMSLHAEQLEWERYLRGVAQARLGQWGDNFTIMAASGVLKRMVVVRSVGPSKTLSLFEIEPPDHLGEGESSGIPLVLGHLCDYHYLPVRVKRDGPWGWALDGDPPGGADDKEVQMEGLPAEQGLTASRISSPQRRSDLGSVDVVMSVSIPNTNDLPVRQPTSSRNFSLQRRLVMTRRSREDLDRREAVTAVNLNGGYAGTVMLGRSLSVERWFSERASSLRRGAESDEDWSLAWGADSKVKLGREEVKGEVKTYAGSSHVDRVWPVVLRDRGLALELADGVRRAD